MPCLNQEILFDIGKKLVEEGNNEDDVYKFALSGKESLKALLRVFYSVTTLVLYKDRYGIGWYNASTVFEFEKGKAKFLMEKIGNSVTKLHIDDIFPLNCDLYQSLLNKIIAKKQLVSFSYSGSAYGKSFIKEFLPTFFSTLKYVSLPSKCMTKSFRDSLNLKSLTILNGKGLSFFLYLCKTQSLEIRQNGISCFQQFEYSSHNSVINILSTIKNLTFNENVFRMSVNDVSRIMNHFGSLETLTFNIAVDHLADLTSSLIFIDILAKKITETTKLPSKVIFTFHKSHAISDSSFFYLFWEPQFRHRYLCNMHAKLILRRRFEHDETITNFCCYRKIIQFPETESTLLEVQVF